VSQPALFEKIDRPRSLPDEIARKLSSAISGGQLKPGDRLPTEQALSDQFGVARTVVREAISLLKYDGIIQSRRGVGAFISDAAGRSAFRISPACFEKRKQLAQLLQVRTAVQADASALAAKAHTADQLAAIGGFLNGMISAIALGSDAMERHVDAEFAFYRAITEASGNDYYVEFIGMIETNVMENLRSVAIKNAKAAECGEAVLAEHQRVFDAISARDEEGARRSTREHFELAAQRLIDRADIADV
jgi:GntR family transcriptional repressor for pyruvate dehydrogenase complex